MKHHMRSRARVESVVHQLNYQLLVGIDLGQWLHQACVLDANGEFLGERGFEHSLSALSATTDWLLNLAGKDAERIAVAIEKPHGAVVETLLDSGIAVFSINPKQVDRFRDRHSMSGAKDDCRDAFVLADALRTDGHRFQRLQLPPPEIISMRELLKTRDQLVKNHVALSSQIRDLLARCWPHLVSLAPRDKALDSFFCKLLQLFFDARETADLIPKVIQDLVSKHRIRRVQPEQILKPLNNHRSASRQQPPKLLPLTSNCSFTSCSSFDNTAENSDQLLEKLECGSNARVPDGARFRPLTFPQMVAVFRALRERELSARPNRAPLPQGSQPHHDGVSSWIDGRELQNPRNA